VSAHHSTPARRQPIGVLLTLLVVAVVVTWSAPAAPTVAEKPVAPAGPAAVEEGTGGSSQARPYHPVAAGPAATGGLRWTALGGPGPPAMGVRALTYDAHDGYVLMLGQPWNATYLQTWSLTQGVWTEICSGTASPPTCPAEPPTVYGVGMAYDAHDGYVVLFGGCFCNVPPYTDSNQTWMYANGNWTNISSLTRPPVGPDSDFAMVYDSEDGYVLRVSSSGVTSTFQNGSWNLSTVGSLGPRGDAVMFDDPTDGYVVLYGGADDPLSANSDTLTYVRGVWTDHYPPGPNVDSEASAVWDPYSGVAVLYGGIGHDTDFSPISGGATTWVYQNASWINLTEYIQGAPPACDYCVGSLAFDPSTNSTILVGNGNSTSPGNITWVLSTQPLLVGVASNLGSATDLDWNTTLSVLVLGGTLTYSYSWSGLPTGCDAGNTSVVLCYPTGVGTFDVMATVTDRSGTTSTGILALIVNPDPVLSVMASTNMTDGGLPIAFSGSTAGGTPPYGVGSWSFGDSGQGSGTQVSHTYHGAGTFQVWFTDLDHVGFRSRVSTTVVILPELETTCRAALAVVDANAQDPLFGTYSGGYPPYSLGWVISTGATFSGGLNLTWVAPSSAGRFNATFWVTDGLAEASQASTWISVNPALVVSAAANSSDPQARSPVGFVAAVAGGTPPYTFLWQFGDGSSNTSENTTHSYASPGAVTARLTVIDQGGGAATWSTTLGVQPLANETHSPPPGMVTPAAPPPWLLIGAGAAGGAGGVALVWWIRSKRPGA